MSEVVRQIIVKTCPWRRFFCKWKVMQILLLPQKRYCISFLARETARAISGVLLSAVLGTFRKSHRWAEKVHWKEDVWAKKRFPSLLVRRPKTLLLPASKLSNDLTLGCEASSSFKSQSWQKGGNIGQNASYLSPPLEKDGFIAGSYPAGKTQRTLIRFHDFLHNILWWWIEQNCHIWNNSFHYDSHSHRVYHN